MAEQMICSNSETCLHYINSKFELYKTKLDEEQHTSDQLIASIREQIASSRSNQEEFLRQLDYLEEESFKTYEENKTCKEVFSRVLFHCTLGLFKMFQHLFHLHREFAFDEVLTSEQRIAELFQYRPSLLSNIEKLRATLPIKPIVTHSKGFSNRADVEAFKQKTDSTPLKLPSPIASNEIDLTKFIRDNQSNQPYEFQSFHFLSIFHSSRSTPFKFSQIAQHSQPSKSVPLPSKKPSIPCDDALLSAANKRFVLLFNINHPEMLHVYDMQTNQTKEYQWDEGILIEKRHVFFSDQ